MGCAYEALDRDVAKDAAAPRVAEQRTKTRNRRCLAKHMPAMGGVTARMRDDVLLSSAPIERFSSTITRKTFPDWCPWPSFSRYWGIGALSKPWLRVQRIS